jgi:hypothetical protein
MTLDVLSPRGQQSRVEEERAYRVFAASYPDFQLIQTRKQDPAAIDAILVRDGVLAAVVETKCRSCKSETFFGAFGGEWLITRDKLVVSHSLAKWLCVPLVGLLYLAKDDLLLAASLWRPGKGWVIPIRSKETETQATCNGGRAVRLNSFVDMSGAAQLKLDGELSAKIARG